MKTKRILFIALPNPMKRIIAAALLGLAATSAVYSQVPAATPPAPPAQIALVRDARDQSVHVPILNAAELSGTAATKGQLLCVRGVIKRNFQPGLSTNDRFYTELAGSADGPVICEFVSGTFVARNQYAMAFPVPPIPMVPASRDSASGSVKLEGGKVAVYVKVSRYDESVRQPGIKVASPRCGETLLPGTTEVLAGYYESTGGVGVNKGLVLRDCWMVSPSRIQSAPRPR